MKKLQIILFLLISSFSFSQTWFTYTPQNTNGKLPDNNVDCLAVDLNNNLWIGTYFYGLVKFDGTNWTNYNTQNSPLKNNDIRGLAVDKQNNIWIATYSDGVFKFNQSTNTWTEYSKNNGSLPDNNTYDIAVDKNGNVWVGVYAYYNTPSVMIFDGTKWNDGPKLTNTVGSNNYPARVIHVDKFNNVWCGNETGLYKFDGNNWNVFRKENTNGALCGNEIKAISSDANGNIWIGSINYENYQYSGCGLTKYDGKTWISYNSPSYQIDEFVSAIAFKGNEVWVGTGYCGLRGNNKGIYVFDGSNFTNYNSNTTFPGQCVNDIVVDNKGVVWIGSANGLTRYGTTVDIQKEKELPTDFSLSAYPNPFNPTTKINYEIPKDGIVTIKIYNIIGNEIATLVNEYKRAGIYTTEFSSLNSELSSGVYFCRLISENVNLTTKLVLAK